MTTQATIHTVLAQHLVSSGVERNFKFDRMDEFSKINISIAELAKEIAAALEPQPAVHPSDAHLLNSEQIAGYTFVKVDGEDRWIARGPDQELLFELSRQDYVGSEGPEEADDWGVWSVVDEDWAHVPADTGYFTKSEAIRSFESWLTHNR